MRKVLYTLILCLPALLFCQSNEKLNSKVTLRGYVGIPRIVGSKMFRTAFNGVVEGGLSANIRVKKNFYTGLGYQYNNFVNNKALFAYYKVKQGSLSYNTRLIAHSGYVKAGYDKFFSEIGYISYAVNVGYMTAGYEKVNPDSSALNMPFRSTKFGAPYFQPEISFNFLAEKAVSFSVLLSYATVIYRFDARAPRFNHVGEVRDESNRANMNWINIGIGFNVLLGKDK